MASYQTSRILSNNSDGAQSAQSTESDEPAHCEGCENEHGRYRCRRMMLSSDI